MIGFRAAAFFGETLLWLHYTLGVSSRYRWMDTTEYSMHTFNDFRCVLSICSVFFNCAMHSIRRTRCECDWRWLQWTRCARMPRVDHLKRHYVRAMVRCMKPKWTALATCFMPQKKECWQFVDEDLWFAQDTRCPIARRSSAIATGTRPAKQLFEEWQMR